MKKVIIYFLAIALTHTVLTGCDDFLDTQSYTTKDSNSFPVNENDANQLLVGVYGMLNTSHAEGPRSWFLISELASDDRFGASGRMDPGAQAMGHLLTTNPNGLSAFWSDRYRGIARATEAIDALDIMEDGELKNQKIGEAKFLRAHWYFELAQAFGRIPIVTVIPQDVSQTKDSPPQAEPEAVYRAIATDLWEAYSTMPAVQWGTANMPPDGTVTKWAAAGLLARVYLFYTGLYEKTSLPVEGGQLTEEQIIGALNELINDSGHDLLPDFRSLWPYTNSVTKPDYPFAQDAPTWVEGSQNSETIFTIKFNGLADFGPRLGFRNPISLFFAPRSGGGTRDTRDMFPIGTGWGWGTVNSNLFLEWPDDDPRKRASIFNHEEETNNYQFGLDNQMEDTGMWQKKVITTTAYGKGGNPDNLWNNFWSTPAYGDQSDDNNMLRQGTDLILIRFADILLMHSELTKTADGINRVRHRASPSLPTVSYTEDNLRNERRWELAFEGLRWGDIRRWRIAEDVLETIYGVAINNEGTWTTMKPQGPGLKARYQATNGFFNIPQTEIDLSKGAYTQNPGWEEGSNSFYTQWVDN